MGRAAIQGAGLEPMASERLKLGTSATGLIISVIAAGLVAACLLSTAGNHPLPALPWAAAFLVLVVQQDVSRLRIPNWLTFPSLAVALGLGVAFGGAAGLGAAFAGAGVALAVMFLPFAMGWLGAGDVKAGMVLGALWGFRPFLDVFWWMVIVGGVMAIALVALQGGLFDLISRWARSAWYSARTARLVYFAPSADSSARTGLPFGLAMGLGAAAYQIWGSPWL